MSDTPHNDNNRSGVVRTSLVPARMVLEKNLELMERDAEIARLTARIAELERKAARWDECERRAEEFVTLATGRTVWRTTPLYGPTFAAAIDAAIAERNQREETTK